MNKDLNLFKRTVSEEDFSKVIFYRETLAFFLRKDNIDIFMFFDPTTSREEEVKLLLKSNNDEYNNKLVDIDYINNLLENGWSGYIYDDVHTR